LCGCRPDEPFEVNPLIASFDDKTDETCQPVIEQGVLSVLSSVFVVVGFDLAFAEVFLHTFNQRDRFGLITRIDKLESLASFPQFLPSRHSPERQVAQWQV